MKLYMPITVNLYDPYPLKVMNVKQYDTGRGALVTLTGAGGEVIVPDQEGLYVYAKKPDGTMVYNTVTLSGTQLKIDYDEQMTVATGVLQVELQTVGTDGSMVSTPIFAINVLQSNMDVTKITSTDEFKALVESLAEVAELKKTGLKGDPGEAATIRIGTVTTSDPGGEAQVENSGTSQDAVFNFVIPRGEEGPQGPVGPGVANTVTYDNETSGLEAENVQGAIDKLSKNLATLTTELSALSMFLPRYQLKGSANDITQPGAYVLDTASTDTNGATSGYLLHFSARDDANVIVQLMISYNGNGVLRRTCWYGAWNDWISFS